MNVKIKTLKLALLLEVDGHVLWHRLDTQSLELIELANLSLSTMAKNDNSLPY
jgi:hypothetical protein